MKVERVRVTPFRLALRVPLSTARESFSGRAGVLIEIAGEGAHGFGAAMPVAGFGLESPAAARNALIAIARDLVASPECALETRLASLATRHRDAPAARAAADAALHDLAARHAGVALSRWLAGEAGVAAPPDRVAVHALLSEVDVAALEASARVAVAAGYGALKLKLSAASLAADLARVGAVRRAVAPGVRIRLDANGSFREREAALRALERLAAHDPELIEQPLAASALADAAWLRARSPIPLAADESATDEPAVARVIDAGAADLVVVKPAACGGLAAAAGVVRQCRGAGLPFFVTSLLDSSLSIAAAGHFAASLGEPAPVCGLATGDLLADDLCDPLAVTAGRLQLPRSPGIGVEADPARVERLATGATSEHFA